MKTRPKTSKLMRASTSLVLLLSLSSCIETGGERADSEIPERDNRILIGAFNFSESQILAELYHQALESEGFDADVLSNVGPREVIEPALEQDQIDIAVEYLGGALAFLNEDAVADADNKDQALEFLREEFALKGVRVLKPAPGQNRNEFVVTTETATEYGLRSISDLQSVDSQLTFGGPPECPSRPLCLEGLGSAYQLEFQAFTPLDSGGPQTVAALESGAVDVALLFTTNPVIDKGDLVVLKDDRHMQPPENILPVIREDLVSRFGGSLVRTLDSVTELLTDEELRRLNAAVDLTGSTPEEAASDWLTDKGLI